jgi:branched-chain amino acid transport system substrate-binding protein
MTKMVKMGLLFVINCSLVLMPLAFSRPAFCKTLLIGVDTPLSGPGAPWGLGQLRGIQKAVEEVDAKGGLRIAGVNYTLDVKAYDHKAKVDEAVAIANKLVFDDKVKYVMGGSIGATCRAIQTITAPNNVYFSFS